MDSDHAYCVGYFKHLFLDDSIVRREVEKQSNCTELLAKDCIEWRDRESSKMRFLLLVNCIQYSNTDRI